MKTTMPQYFATHHPICHKLVEIAIDAMTTYHQHPTNIMVLTQALKDDINDELAYWDEILTPTSKQKWNQELDTENKAIIELLAVAIVKAYGSTSHRLYQLRHVDWATYDITKFVKHDMVDFNTPALILYQYLKYAQRKEAELMHLDVIGNTKGVE